ncbi:MAG: tyrosine-type recombinase/integrase [archaeon]|nr:tyrosine-type recombinase/integrase [archaeon]
MAVCAEVYDYDRILEKVLRSLKLSNIPQENKSLIEKFSRYLFAQGLSCGRIIKYVIEIRKLAELVNKPFSEMTKEDIVEIVQKIERRPDYSENTKQDYKLSIKKFFRFLKGEENYPEEVRWIRITSKRCTRKLPEELLTEEEVKRMAEAARTPRDRALVLVLYESGCRIGETLSLKIRNVQFDEYGAVLTVDGKTGMRRVRVIASSPALASWINIHPLREDHNTPLWVSLGTNSRDLPLKHRTASELLRTLARKAGIKKRVYPHLFRHSRATHLANQLTEAQLKQHFGWVQSSEMASTYVHLSGRDVDNALLRLNGIVNEENRREEGFKVVICPRCHAKNTPDSKFCNICGLCLDVKTSIELDKVREKADRLMSALISEPKVLDAILKTIRELDRSMFIE